MGAGGWIRSKGLRDDVGVNCRSKFLINPGMYVIFHCFPWRGSSKLCTVGAKDHLWPLYNSGVYVRLKSRWSPGHAHIHTHNQRGPSLLMHDQSIMHFCAFTHRWQDNRITEKKDLGRQNLPRLWEQPDSFLYHKRWRTSCSTLSFSDTNFQSNESIILVSPSFPEPGAAVKVLFRLDCMHNICT